MTRRLVLTLAAAAVLAVPSASHAALAPYSQNFEAMVASDPGALQNDGWLVYGNVFNSTHTTYLYGYGPYPAPNPGAGFCAVDVGQGGPQQGANQLSVYSDYNNTDHANGNLIESNVYREQTIGAGDVGTRWTFQFDAKLGNLSGTSTAVAFIKTLDQAHGYALTNFITVDMTAIPATWNTYTLSITIAPALAGQLLQIGFANTTTNYQGSGVFYDNVSLQLAPAGVPQVSGPAALELGPAAPNPFPGSTRIGFRLAARGVADVAIYDASGRRVATLFRGEADAGPHAATWNGRAADGRLAPAGVYQCVLQTDAGRQSRRVVLSR